MNNTTNTNNIFDSIEKILIEIQKNELHNWYKSLSPINQNAQREFYLERMYFLVFGPNE